MTDPNDETLNAETSETQSTEPAPLPTDQQVPDGLGEPATAEG